jgi:hypothetical protein
VNYPDCCKSALPSPSLHIPQRLGRHPHVTDRVAHICVAEMFCRCRALTSAIGQHGARSVTQAMRMLRPLSGFTQVGSLHTHAWPMLSGECRMLSNAHAPALLRLTGPRLC